MNDLFWGVHGFIAVMLSASIFLLKLKLLEFVFVLLGDRGERERDMVI